MLVHGLIALTGIVGVSSAAALHDFGGGFALATVLVVVGIAGVARRPEH